LNIKYFIDYLFLIILGMLTSLSLPPFNYFFINFFTFAFFLLFLIQRSNQNIDTKIFFFYGWLFGFGYFITNLYWISISLTHDPSFKLLIPVTVILIPAFLSLFYGLAAFFFRILNPKSIINSFLIFSLILGILEFIRGSIFTGFPWNLIVYSLSNQLEVISITSILGTYGLNLFCISLFSSPAILILKLNKKNLGVVFLFLILTILFYIHGFAYKERFQKIVLETYDYKIRAVGSNIGLNRFYSDMNTISVIKELIKISEPKSSHKTVFIWPEGIIPNIIKEDLKEYSWLFEENFSQNHILILGINSQVVNNKSKDYFNSLSVYDNKLNLLNSYNKINLVPFGEFLPFENFLKKTGLRSLTNNYQSFSKGSERKVIEIIQPNITLKILPLICYEIIYSGKLFDNLDFDFIINISEDGWFGHSIGPKQHFVHSIFRAIESGKYIIRSSNNGITGIINPLGNVEKSVNFRDTGYVDLKEIRKIQPTIFSIYGNKIFGLLILLYIFLIFSFKKIKYE
tara:strand:- start:134 stop:1678 length:1545 start_codon:yes stop_codon:yes gene_type:complete